MRSSPPEAACGRPRRELRDGTRRELRDGTRRQRPERVPGGSGMRSPPPGDARGWPRRKRPEGVPAGSCETAPDGTWLNVALAEATRGRPRRGLPGRIPRRKLPERDPGGSGMRSPPLRRRGLGGEVGSRVGPYETAPGVRMWRRPRQEAQGLLPWAGGVRSAPLGGRRTARLPGEGRVTSSPASGVRRSSSPASVVRRSSSPGAAVWRSWPVSVVRRSSSPGGSRVTSCTRLPDGRRRQWRGPGSPLRSPAWPAVSRWPAPGGDGRPGHGSARGGCAATAATPRG